MGELVALAARETGLSVAQIVGPSRRSDIVRTRFAVVWVAYFVLGGSMRGIGLQLGDRDHTTIINAFTRAEQLRSVDATFQALTDRLAEPFAEITRG